MNKQGIKALILAGGFGTRLKEMIHGKPKVMAPINGRPFLEFIINNLKRNGISDIVISTGYLGEYIKKHFDYGHKYSVHISYSEEDYPLRTGGALVKARNFFKETFLVLNGDTFLDVNFDKILDFHKRKKASATVILTKKGSIREKGLAIKQRSGKIISFDEKPKSKKVGMINTGYYFIEPRILKDYKSGIRISLEKDIFQSLAKKGVLYGAEVKKRFIDIGTPTNYKRAHKIFSKQKRSRILSKAPVRVSFAGGGTDLPEYFLKHKGAVTSTTINLYAHVEIEKRSSRNIEVFLKDFGRRETLPLDLNFKFDGGPLDIPKAALKQIPPKTGANITIWGDFPKASGLGTSSAVNVALVGALMKLNSKRVIKKQVARHAVAVERDILKIPGGWQDQYACTFGGLNHIKFSPDGNVTVKSLNISPTKHATFEKHLLLFFLGGLRSERKQQVHLRKSIKAIESKRKTKEAFEMLYKLATEVKICIENGNFKKFGKLLHHAWIAKKTSSSKISNPQIDRIYNLALKKGAWGGKLLGSGGGGCILFCAPPSKQKTLVNSLLEKGLDLIPFSLDSKGLRVYET